MPERTQVLLGHEETPRLFGIRYYVGRRPSNAAQQEVFTSKSGLKVYRDSRIGDPISAFRTEPCTAADRFASLSRTPSHVVIEADLGCPALVQVGDAFYPGWRARVDGSRVPVQELYAVRGVRADRGRHRIEFFYRPASMYWGLGMAVTAFIVLWVLCIRDSPRRRTHPYRDSIAVS
jgi:hypothetical protein